MSISKSTGTAQAISSSDRPKDARRDGRINAHMIANVLLIWLDTNIDENNSEWQNTVSHLRRDVYTINIFADAEECIDFLGDVEDEKVCI